MSTIGTHFAISRDLAKQMFSCRTDAALQVFLSQSLRDPTSPSPALETDNWQPLETLLASLAARTDPPRNALAQLFLGGRRLGEGRQLTAVLVRPDLVPIIAAQLPQEELDAIHAASDEQRRQLAALRDFFAAAATRRDAVLFYTDQAT